MFQVIAVIVFGGVLYRINRQGEYLAIYTCNLSIFILYFNIGIKLNATLAGAPTVVVLVVLYTDFDIESAAGETDSCGDAKNNGEFATCGS